MRRRVPTCNKCGGEHYNMLPCPPERKPADYLRRHGAPDGFRVSDRWGVNTRGVPIAYTLPPRPTHGTLIGADGNSYIPDIPAA